MPCRNESKSCRENKKVVAGKGEEGRKNSDENDRSRQFWVLPALTSGSPLTGSGDEVQCFVMYHGCFSTTGDVSRCQHWTTVGAPVCRHPWSHQIFPSTDILLDADHYHPAQTRRPYTASSIVAIQAIVHIYHPAQLPGAQSLRLCLKQKPNPSGDGLGEFLSSDVPHICEAPDTYRVLG